MKLLTSALSGTFSLNSAISATCSAFAVDAALTSCSSSALKSAFKNQIYNVSVIVNGNHNTNGNDSTVPTIT